MTGKQAISAILRGLPVRSTPQEYPEVRAALQAQAEQWIDQKREDLAGVAYEEIYRLDVLFGHRRGARGGAELN